MKKGSAKKTENASDSNDTPTQSSSSGSSGSIPIYRYSEIDFSRIKLIKPPKSDVANSVMFVNYSDPVRKANTTLYVQSGRIKITSYGIPRLTGPDYKGTMKVETDKDREFIKIPLDGNQPPCRELRKHLEDADQWAGSDSVKSQVLGNRKDKDKYSYVPCIKSSSPKEDEPDQVPMESVKFKFRMETGENKESINKTSLRRIEGKDKKEVKADTITEVAKEITFLSEVRFVFNYSKMWVFPATKQYGIGFKIITIDYVKAERIGIPNNLVCIDEDDDVEREQPKKIQSRKPLLLKMDSDNEDEPEEKPKKSSKKKNESDEDEPEEKPKKSSKKKNESDEDEPEEKPKKSSKKKNESDEDEPEEKPKKSSKKKDEVEETKSSKSGKKEDVPTKKSSKKEEKKAPKEDEEDDIPIKKSNSKKEPEKKTSRKPVVEDDDNEESDEDIKNKKKSKGKSQSKSKAD